MLVQVRVLVVEVLVRVVMVVTRVQRAVSMARDDGRPGPQGGRYRSSVWIRVRVIVRFESRSTQNSKNRTNLGPCGGGRGHLTHLHPE